eukprot:CAMPEP_0183303146 /NCGR_PEP_ID=MMETSP0160_2-20130417/8695_1 /TAXON_ID=2839 ORGANISM="Odontella Sinensis, Strain Grunow 1884" /NCGR_SAMPLE_ID=MMETSP0160_2 /ASSEMBLY_ACC=CAM_ASM_000250 /LENGTH=109 /DNA_ID=CAMNT_0025466013 /DNA_START=141 /DNA_END=470 /DNA_ORIENTATION=+
MTGPLSIVSSRRSEDCVVSFAADVESRLDKHFREFADFVAEMEEQQSYRSWKNAVERDADRDASPPPPPVAAARLPTAKEVGRPHKAERNLSRKTRRRIRRQRKIFEGL